MGSCFSLPVLKLRDKVFMKAKITKPQFIPKSDEGQGNLETLGPGRT